MPNPTAVANVLVLVAAGVGAVIAIACVLQLLRNGGAERKSEHRLASRREG